jgi:hypothetical protein
MTDKLTKSNQPSTLRTYSSYLRIQEIVHVLSDTRNKPAKPAEGANVVGRVKAKGNSSLPRDKSTIGSSPGNDTALEAVK